MVDLSAGSAEPWHLDRKVPITLILTMLGGITGGTWFAATATHRLSVIESGDGLTSSRITTLESSRQITGERLARIEQLSVDNQDMLRRILERVK